MAYERVNWENLPSTKTPINRTNLIKMENGIKNNDINIGEENYDNTKTYEVGDIVRYNEKIYKCITAITTAENFDISKWEQTNIVEIVQSEKSKIYELIEALSTPIVGEGENITLNDTAEKRFEKFDIEGNSEQEATPSPDYPSEVESCGDNGSINVVICNKNLLDKNLLVLNKWINGDNGTINTSTSGNYYATEKYIPFNQYVGKTITSVETMAIAFYDSNKTFISINKSTNPRQVVVPSKTEYIRVEVRKEYYEVAQLELGSTATPYQEHKEQTYTIPTQQPIRSIETEKNTFLRDTFIKKNNKWYERHYIYRQIFDGTETNCNQSTVNNKIVYNFKISKSSSNAEYGKIADAISSHFIAQNQNSTGKNLNRFSLTNNMVIFCTDGISTIDSFKTLLAEQYNAGTPVYIDYVLKEPLDIECTEEQSTILFDIEQNAKTYKGVTHIYSNDDVSPNCYVEAVKDLTTLIQ